MIKAVLISLVLGGVIGDYIAGPEQVEFFGQLSDWALVILMFSVGISVGMNKDVFKKVKQYHVKILVIPFGIIVGSLVGGAVSAVILGMPLNEGIAIASGLGWYSLSGVLLTDLAGADVGTIAFLGNLMREIISFMIIPIIATRFNHYTAIAPAAATSEDTTLPILMKYTSEDVVVMAVINGVICSTFVPILIQTIYQVV